MSAARQAWTIDAALCSPKLLGPGIGDLATWRTWRVVLKAAFALGLGSAEERAIFEEVSGGRPPPEHRVSELWAVLARRTGKSRMAAAVGCYLACFLPRKLAAGEVGEVTIVSASREQAGVVFKYILGFLEASPVLRKEVESATTTEVRLRGNVVLSTRAGNYRTVRGRTLLAAIIDEVAFLHDETSALPDIEVYRALLPALATTGGMLIGISTPYRKLGLLYQKHRDYFGVADPDVLVVSGNAPRFNPTINVSVIERARASDPEAARAEWDAEFRTDIGAFLDDQSIDAAVDHGRPLELPPREGVLYHTYVDMGGGRHDASTIGIMHFTGEGDERRYVADVVRGRKGDPHAAVREFVELAKQYRCSVITGDNYGAEWVAGSFREAGAEYLQSKLVRSELYLAGLPLFTRGVVGIPNLAQLLRELRLLERRTARSGRDTVDHGVGGSDDYANALFGALHLAASVPVNREPPIVVPFIGPIYNPVREAFRPAW